MRIEGPMKDLIMQGDLKARDVTMGVDYLGTKYRFDEADFFGKIEWDFYPLSDTSFWQIEEREGEGNFCIYAQSLQGFGVGLECV